MGMVAVKLRSRDLIVSISLALRVNFILFASSCVENVNSEQNLATKTFVGLDFCRDMILPNHLDAIPESGLSCKGWVCLIDFLLSWQTSKRLSLLNACTVLTKHHKICSKDYGARSFLCIKFYLSRKC
jgi:hypothetical protein